jgi:hypothetical protein
MKDRGLIQALSYGLDSQRTGGAGNEVQCSKSCRVSNQYSYTQTQVEITHCGTDSAEGLDGFEAFMSGSQMMLEWVINLSIVVPIIREKTTIFITENYAAV